VVDVCDIDGVLDKIAEEHFLGQKLHPKIVFYRQSARYFIHEKIKAGEQYDMIFIDAYNGKISIPSELLTKEFFDSVKLLSRGTIAMNLIIDSSWQSDFARKLSNTLSASL
jgi:spermidine synthase